VNLNEKGRTAMNAAAGWYPQEDGRLRYWDGEAWTTRYRDTERRSDLGHTKGAVLAYWKTAVGTVLGIVLGILMGLFGVLNSVFSDGSPDESLVFFIGVILAIYTTLGVLWGLLLPEQGWKWGLVLAGPGAAVVLLMLVMYLMATTAGGEGGPVLFGSLLLYAVLLLATTCLGAWAGSASRRSRKQRASASLDN
jgi:hypothetical protein